MASPVLGEHSTAIKVIAGFRFEFDARQGGSHINITIALHAVIAATAVISRGLCLDIPNIASAWLFTHDDQTACRKAIIK
jgi:hypothetical protein